MKLSEKIIYLRKQHGMSQEDLSQKISVSRQAISRWEGGLALPDASNILQLSKLFGVSADYLLNDEYDSNDEILISRKKNQNVGKYDFNKLRIIIGAIVSGIAMISMLIIGIISSVKPAVYIVQMETGATRGYTGLSGFLKNYNLEWLFILLLIILVSGIVTIFYPKIKPYIMKLLKK